MSRPSKAQLQEQVQLLKEEEGIVEQPEKIVLQDAAAVKHKLDHTAAEASSPIHPPTTGTAQGHTLGIVTDRESPTLHAVCLHEGVQQPREACP